MNGWAFFFFAALLMTGISLLISDAVRRQHELKQMERMRRSRMYYDLYPLVQYARRHNIDRVQIERTRIIFYAVSPPGKMGQFVLEEMKYRPLSPRHTRALTLVLAEDLAPLQEKKWYRLKKYYVMRPNGIRDEAYQYIITPRYKTALVSRKNRVHLY
ncbi:MAG: hypothetical protein IJD39_07460 [Clostridia bacterium]|nr:hypothetical protein [Clostridia bacterium]